MREDKTNRLYTVKHTIGKLKIPSSTFYTRISRGYTFEEALQPQLSKEESIRRAVDAVTKFYSKGKSVRSQLTEREYAAFYMRVKKGMHPRQALRLPFKSKQLYYFEGKPIQEIFTKKALVAIHTRLNRGWGITKACTFPLEKRAYGRVWFEDLERIKEEK